MAVRWLAVLAVFLPAAAPALAQHTPASTPPLPPAEAEKKFAVPDGFEVRLFAAEPDVVNPVAMTWDERGRLWVVELYEYPLGAQGGKPRDQVKILEDTNDDGRADRVKVFADGFNLATGIALGRGGVFVGQAPDLLFLQDTNGDDVADKRAPLLTGFGRQDTHELLNGFVWGPDGWLYMTHGVFTYSTVKNPNDPSDDGVKINAAVGRYHPVQKTFELFADGTSNPWGIDFDRAGNAFLSACVIDHLFHIVPGGIYIRQAGEPGNPYAYDLLPSIVDHAHQRAAYAGVLVYQGDQFPDEYRGTVFMGNIHGNCVNRDRLTPKGSTFRASAEPDFLAANDGWFRPVSVQVGPDGALWVMDWYDRYPCYQNAAADPQGVDRKHGRIWRVVYTGVEKGARRPTRPFKDSLAKRSTAQLVELLAHPNVWQRRTAQRLLSERRDRGAAAGLKKLLAEGKTQEARLAALWTLHGAELLDDASLDALAADAEPSVRTWVARLTGERTAEAAPRRKGAGTPKGGPGKGTERLARLARDPDPAVRLGVAASARKLSGEDAAPVVAALREQPAPPDDPALPFLIWLAAEAKVAKDPKPFLEALRASGAPTPGAVGLLRKAVRRVCDAGEAARMDDVVAFLAALSDRDAPFAAAVLDGLLEGQKEKTLKPKGAGAPAALGRLLGSADPGVIERAQQLAALWGVTGAAEAVLKRLANPQASDAERVQAVRVARRLKTDAARDALIAALGDPRREAVAVEALRALGEVGGERVPEAVLRPWKAYPPAARRAAVEVLASRPVWAGALLKAVEDKTVAPDDIPLPVRRTLAQHEDPALRARIAQALGLYRETPADKARLISEKKRVALAGPVDFEAGRTLVRKHCLTCHSFYGEGAAVGPDLTGVGRSSLDSLLTNVIDPSQVIGKGYEQAIIRTKDERVLSGRLVEDSPARVRLLAAGPKEETVARAEVADVKVTDQSVMPEGLEQMPDADFRNLIWYVLAPPQDREARIRVEPGDRQLAVRARSPGKDEWVDLLSYVIDPASRPYLHPVRDPSGRTALTEDRPGDHPWQHGIFTGLHKVNGIDFWTEKQGKQRFVALLDVQTANDRAGWRSLTEWVGPDGGVVLEEEQAIAAHAPESADAYAIDFDWLLRAKDKDVTIGRHEYGGLAVRMAFDPKHTHLNAGGRRDKDTAENRAGWCNVARAFGEETFGIAILDHPHNPLHPPAWRVDGQGLINPSPSLQGDWTVPAGKARAFRYRLVVHRGPGDAGALGKAFERFAAVPFDPGGEGCAGGMDAADPITRWCPGWRVASSAREGTPAIVAAHAGRKNVLSTHPFEEDKPAALERIVEIPEGKRATLSFWVCSHPEGDWELRVVADGEVLEKRAVGKTWERVSVDLTRFAGRAVRLRLENAASGWSFEFGYWSEVQLRIDE